MGTARPHLPACSAFLWMVTHVRPAWAHWRRPFMVRGCGSRQKMALVGGFAGWKALHMTASTVGSLPRCCLPCDGSGPLGLSRKQSLHHSPALQLLLLLLPDAPGPPNPEDPPTLETQAALFFRGGSPCIFISPKKMMQWNQTSIRPMPPPNVRVCLSLCLWSFPS